jgi:membrane protease YdiL (CAAX protease family)
MLGLTLPLPTPAAALWVLVMAPVVEEWVFRALLQREIAAALLRRFGQRFSALGAQLTANMVASIGFAVAHAPLHGWMAVGWILPGLLLGECWRRTQSLWACAALHSSMNLALWVVSR